jgi:DNA mismatch repair protein MSH6
MVKKSESVKATPAKPPTLKKETSSTGSKNGSILNFFAKKAPANGTPDSTGGGLSVNPEPKGVNAMAKPALPIKKPAFKKAAVKNMTPVPSSDAAGPSSSQENENGGIPKEVEDNGLPSPATPAERLQVVNGNGSFGSSPSRKVWMGLQFFRWILINVLLPQAKKPISYAESDDEDDDPVCISTNKRKAKTAQVVEDDDDEDTFIGGLDGAADDDDGKRRIHRSMNRL